MSTSIGRKALQGLAAGIGLVSEASSARKLKKQRQLSPTQTQTRDVSRDDFHACEMSVESGGSSVYELPTEDGLSPGALETQWALDEAQEDLKRDSSDSKSPQNDTTQTPVEPGCLAENFLSTYPAPPPYSLVDGNARPRLSAPVVIPQRRPKNRDRGFIRAYAPALEDCGIDQDMFLNFLNTAEKSCQANPWLNAINLASIGTMWMPSVTGIAVSIAIQIATDVAIAADGRRKTNSFFDKMNKEFFRPRGLYCLIMTWNPELSDAPSTAIDVNSLVSKASSNGNADAFTRLFHRFKSSDGKTYGNIFQDVAPLVFPEIDELASDENAGKKLSKLKRKKEFVGGYLDRRAQAKFTADNPTSHLSQGPKPVFTSRYADPNHPASSGDPLALLSAGRFTMEDLPRRQLQQSRFEGRSRFERQDSYRTRDNSHFNSNSPAPHAPHGRPFGLFEAIDAIKELRSPSNNHYEHRPGVYNSNRDYTYDTTGTVSRGPRESLLDVREKKSQSNPLAKLLKKEVLYLAIVNMPTEDEMRQAQSALGHANY